MNPAEPDAYRPHVTPARDQEPRRASVAVLLALIDAWIAAATALLLESDYTQSYEVGGRRWHDPLTGRFDPFERSVARARRDAVGGRLDPFTRLVALTEETLVRADGWTPTPTEHGVLWRQPDVDGTPRTLTEAAAVVTTRVLALVSVASEAPPVDGRHVVREGYDQRPEHQGDELAQPAAPDDAPLPAWIDVPRGFSAIAGAWPAPTGRPLGVSFHAVDVALDDEGGVPG